MIKVYKDSEISTFPESITVDELYTGFILECININDCQEKATVYDVLEDISNGSVEINNRVELDEDSIVYRVNPIYNENFLNIKLDIELRNILEDIVIEEISVKDLNIDDYICDSNFYLEFINNKKEILRKGIDENIWINFVIDNKLDDSYELTVPIKVETISYIEKIKKASIISAIINESMEDVFSTKILKNVKSLFIDDVMVKYKYD